MKIIKFLPLILTLLPCWTAATPTAPTISGTYTHGSTVHFAADQIMISNAYQKDLYSVRNSVTP